MRLIGILIDATTAIAVGLGLNAEEKVNSIQVDFSSKAVIRDVEVFPSSDY
jgi:hypothetical protein